MIKELQEGEAPFLMLDPLLLPLLVNCCPREELPAVLSVIPARLSAAMILKQLNIRKGVAAKLTKEDVSKHINLRIQIQFCFHLWYR